MTTDANSAKIEAALYRIYALMDRAASNSLCKAPSPRAEATLLKQIYTMAKEAIEAQA